MLVTAVSIKQRRRPVLRLRRDGVFDRAHRDLPPVRLAGRDDDAEQRPARRHRTVAQVPQHAPRRPRGLRPASSSAARDVSGTRASYSRSPSHDPEERVGRQQAAGEIFGKGGDGGIGHASILPVALPDRIGFIASERCAARPGPARAELVPTRRSCRRGQPAAAKPPGVPGIVWYPPAGVPRYGNESRYGAFVFDVPSTSTAAAPSGRVARIDERDRRSRDRAQLDRDDVVEHPPSVREAGEVAAEDAVLARVMAPDGSPCSAAAGPPASSR